MIYVKEFRTYGDKKIDKNINEWIEANKDNIEVKDIKYQVYYNDNYKECQNKALIIYHVLD